MQFILVKRHICIGNIKEADKYEHRQNKRHIFTNKK